MLCTKGRAGLNFINILRTAFMRLEPKSIRKTVKLSVFLHFWDLRAQKLLVNMLVKLTTDTFCISLTSNGIRFYDPVRHLSHKQTFKFKNRTKLYQETFHSNNKSWFTYVPYAMMIEKNHPQNVPLLGVENCFVFCGCTTR